MMPFILNPADKNNYKCDYCGKPIYRKPSYIKKTKRICCSRKCSGKLKTIYFSGEGNHQYGLKRENNPTYIGRARRTKNGYIFIRDFDHPFIQADGWIWEHRIVAERYLMTDKESVVIGGKKYLNPDLDVHHKDGNKLNNDPTNLEIMTKSQHVRLHNLLKPVPRCDKTGRFISSEKRRKVH